MDNQPNDMVNIKITVLIPFEDNITSILKEVINENNWGTIAYIERSFVSLEEDMFKKENYTIHFKKWKSDGPGAITRQLLQEGNEIDIYYDNILMWKGKYEGYRRLSSNQTINVFDPYNKSPENVQRKKALMRKY